MENIQRPEHCSARWRNRKQTKSGGRYARTPQRNGAKLPRIIVNEFPLRSQLRGRQTRDDQDTDEATELGKNENAPENAEIRETSIPDAGPKDKSTKIRQIQMRPNIQTKEKGTINIDPTCPTLTEIRKTKGSIPHPHPNS